MTPVSGTFLLDIVLAKAPTTSWDMFRDKATLSSCFKSLVSGIKCKILPVFLISFVHLRTKVGRFEMLEYDYRRRLIDEHRWIRVSHCRLVWYFYSFICLFIYLFIYLSMGVNPIKQQKEINIGVTKLQKLGYE